MTFHELVINNEQRTIAWLSGKAAKRTKHQIKLITVSNRIQLNVYMEKINPLWYVNNDRGARLSCTFHLPSKCRMHKNGYLVWTAVRLVDIISLVWNVCARSTKYVHYVIRLVTMSFEMKKQFRIDNNFFNLSSASKWFDFERAVNNSLK